MPLHPIEGLHFTKAVSCISKIKRFYARIIPSNVKCLDFDLWVWNFEVPGSRFWGCHMSLSSSQLDALLECARTGQFTLAAKNLFVTQSALSQRISALEAAIGAQVLIRNRGGLKLTPQGEKLLRYCNLKEQLEAETLADLSDANGRSLSGKIRIAGYSSVMNSLVLKSLSPLIKLHPNLSLHFSTHQMNEVLENLVNGRADFVLLDRSVQEVGFGQVLLGFESNVLAQKKGYDGPDVYLDHDENDPTTQEYFRGKEKLNLKRHFLGDIHGLLEGVRLGLGKAVLPMHLIQGDKSFEMVQSRKILKYPIVLYYLENAPRVKLFDAVLECLKLNIPKMLS